MRMFAFAPRTGYALLAALVVFAAPCFAQAPMRVVSVNVCTDEYVFRLVPKDRIAALSYLAGDHHPVVSTIADRVGGIRLLRQSAEDVLAAKPDLVVTDAGASTRLRQILREAHVPVIDVPWAENVDEVRRVTRMLAAALGSAERGEVLLTQMDADLAQARGRRPAQPVRALVYQPNGYAQAGGIADVMMREGGLMNVAPDLAQSRQGTISVEAVIAASPDLLILGGEASANDSRARAVQHHPALAQLPNSITVTWLPLISLICPGPWSAQAGIDFAEAASRANGLARKASHP